ncbi:hypothetical protein [Marinomonas algicola]|uniref:hypothetical protein n=1 Tax=Marinomonas algicola TaxID=2773454 RepID=UPI00174D206B|nr:hypothetical protein [Marinomonas algicola]
MFDRSSDIAIHRVLNLFEAGDMTLLTFFADDIDLRIDHYKETTDTRWQSCKTKVELMTVLSRLSKEVFPKGTQVTRLTSELLGDGWFITTFEQSFWYGLERRDVDSRTYILSHESNGQVDYFRENVTTLVYR